MLQIAVPRHSVGVVIGRSGEMIKKIQSDAGVKIQFKPGTLSHSTFTACNKIEKCLHPSGQVGDMDNQVWEYDNSKMR